MGKIADVQEVTLTKLVPYVNNAKIHSEEQVTMIASSIREFGFLSPVLIDRDFNIIAGHGRVMAAKKLNMESVPCVFVEGLTEAQRKAYILADNRLGELADWDMDLVNMELEALDDMDFDVSLTGFEMPEIKVEDAEIIEDDVPDDAEARCKLGDIWQLGNHRLICGDCTDINVIDTLMDGAKADMVFTDPPYNIASDSKNFAADVSKAMKNLSESEWDKDFSIREALDNIYITLADNASVYVCTSHFLASEIWDWMKEWSDHYSYCVWSKPNPMPSLAKRHWTWNTELICYATRGKHTFNFPKEGHALSTWTINKRNGDTGHPTEKPVEVPAMAIKHSSKTKDVILDLFGGSGSTLIACEQLDRKCFMCELDPHYCDVIIQRWENLTGKEAVLLDGKDRQTEKTNR